MRLFKLGLFFCLLFLFSGSSFAQNSEGKLQKKYKVAIFSPLYLDSVFSGVNYLYGKDFPKFVSPGLDFALGAELALKNITLSDVEIEAQIFDCKYPNIIQKLIENRQLDDFSLMIGSVKDDEFIQLAKFARQKNIPFISATYPNDGGITDNPNLYIVNSTLKSHCEAIFSYIMMNHSTDNLIFVRKAGNQEDKIAGILNNINKPDQNTLLNFKTINIDSTFYPLFVQLDSTKKNVILGGSLDQDFSKSLINYLADKKSKYDITLMGMPNWEGLRLKKNDFPFYFTSPYNNERENDFGKAIQTEYKNSYKRNPSDFTYKGFETAYTFVNLLIKSGINFSKNINDPSFNVFTEYNFLPVYNKKNTVNYNENKHLYFMKKLNGVVSKMQ